MSPDPHARPPSGLEGWGQTLEWLLPGGCRRALFATQGFGEGHNRPARALQELCRRLRPEVETRVADPLEDPGPSPWHRRRTAYYAALRACPRVYQAAYRSLARWRWPLDRPAAPLVPLPDVVCQLLQHRPPIFPKLRHGGQDPLNHEALQVREERLAFPARSVGPGHRGQGQQDQR